MIFKIRFNVHRKDFSTPIEKSTFSEHNLKEGQEMRSMEETTKILHVENGPKRLNALE